MAITRFSRLHRRRSEDWRILVRSLPVLEGEEAAEVLEGLKSFAERGTKPEWQRQVILAGLRAQERGTVAAVRLLEHWSGTKNPSQSAPLTEPPSLAPWQAWFAQRFPDLPPAMLPVDPPDAKHTFASVLRLATAFVPADPKAGAAAFDKGLCVKCHRFARRGEAMGPDLTSTRQRFQRKEVVQAILYPAHAIPEEYATTVVVTRDGKTYSGVVAASADRVLILGANGEKTNLDRREIEETLPSNLSSKPAGLLDPLSDAEITSLFAYLFAPATDNPN